MSSMFARSILGKNSPARVKSLMSQNTQSASAARSAGTSRATCSASGKNRRFRGTGSCWKYPTRFPNCLSASPSASPAPSVSPSGFTCDTNTNEDRRRSSATISSVVFDCAITPAAELLIDHLGPLERLVQRNGPLGSTILDERELRSIAQIDRIPKLPAQKPRSTLQSIHGLPSHMPIPDDRHEHLAELHVLRDLAPNNGNEPEPRVFEILADDLRQRLLNLMIDPRLPLLLHSNDPG